jgi:uncharacterized protein
MEAEKRDTQPMAVMSAGQIIELLNLKPHPEGGHFVETLRDAAESGARAASTAIYFLLMRGERSNWHRIDATEVWHYYAGAPLELEVAETDAGPNRRLRLGTDFSAGERPQVVVPRHAWQAAESLGNWTLVGCTVAPGFEFAGFQLAPRGWTPHQT